MGREEQIEEREVLDAIFPDEITDISETSYQVSIALDIPNHDEDAETPSILLTVTCPPTYPDIPPALDITHPASTPKAHHLSLPADTPSLLTTLDTTIHESLGQAMIFTLISALKESTEALIQERQGAAQAALDREAAKEEEKENAKFHGEVVTREGFLRWRERFRGEMEGMDEERRRRGEEEGGARGRKVGGGKAEEVKMTGRELWERGLVGRVEEDEMEGEDEDERDALRGVEGLKVDE